MTVAARATAKRKTFWHGRLVHRNGEQPFQTGVPGLEADQPLGLAYLQAALIGLLFAVGRIADAMLAVQIGD